MAQPRAPRAEIVGIHGDALKVRVQAPPVGGEANAELCRLLARALGLRTADVAVRSGAGGRRKLVSLPAGTAIPEPWLKAVSR